jgi:hypothetical protein
MGLLSRIATAIVEKQVDKEESDLEDRRAPTVSSGKKGK